MTLKAILIDKKIRQKKVAAALRMTREAVCKKLNNNYFTIDEIKIIKRQFEIEPEELIKIF